MSQRTQVLGWTLALGLAAAGGQALDADAATRGYRFTKGWQVYQAEVGPNDGCWADYKRSYRGWHRQPLSARQAALKWTDLDVGGYIPSKDGWYVHLAPYKKGVCGEE